MTKPRAASSWLRRVSYVTLVSLTCAGCQTLPADYRLSVAHSEGLNCEQIQARIDLLRDSISQLTSQWINPVSRELEKSSAFEVILYGLAYWPLVITAMPIWAISAEVERENQLRQAQQQLKEFETALHDSGCPDKPASTESTASLPEAKTAPAAGAAGKRTTSGPFKNAIVDISPADVVEWWPENTDVQLTVTDRRTNVVMERTAAGDQLMSGVVLQPSATDLIESIIAAKLKQAIAAQPKFARVPPVTCELIVFSITTPATILYWDVTVDIVIALRVGNQQRSLTAHTVTRTYLWPTESLIGTVTVEALKVIATESGPALSELVTLARSN
jgi:hypothetical protein